MVKKTYQEEPKDKAKIKAKPFAGEETAEEEAMEHKEAESEVKPDMFTKPRTCKGCGKEAELSADGYCKECESGTKEAEAEAEAGYKEGEAEAEAEPESEDEAEKGSLGGENPEEQAAISSTATNTITPGKMTGQRQHVVVPKSSVKVSRDQPKYPNEVQMGAEQSKNIPSYGKSVNTDLQKSPLFVELTKQINDMQKALTSKMEAVEKSYNDRLANLQKTASKIETFYRQPFYKAANENVNPEAIQKDTIKEQIEKGKARFSF